ncbi:hypothetical protein ACFFX1_55125 [Dactylosporangium sucinum]|uniref:Uncharacterized protein n=1 Tax=Dactylosporangium sucinum TaxID=1424081 RepID=A0A917U4L6_9ACTN|nr:hypothetical protein [Dactylosporangium sucinum]GGM53030.1 hypothetical protein GCM10007977_063350 [Dactylosporangium sucinum]
MSTVLDDKRVSPRGEGFAVAGPAGMLHVLHTSAFGWSVYRGSSLDLVRIGTGFAVGYRTPEAAVEAALGVTV